MITTRLLMQLCPNLSALRAAEIATALQAAAVKEGITTRLRVAAFIATILQETGCFQWLEEIWGPTAAQKGYQGRMGNTQPGDNYRFRGRGFFQLTGRNNYARYSDLLGLPLLANPDLAARPDVAALIAARYWTDRKINEPADRGDFREVTRLVNGGYTHLTERTRYYRRALDLLTDVSAPPATEAAPADGEGAVLPLFGVAGFDRVRIMKRSDGQGLKAYGVPVGKEV